LRLFLLHNKVPCLLNSKGITIANLTALNFSVVYLLLEASVYCCQK
jgi:hypothetical protein